MLSQNYVLCLAKTYSIYYTFDFMCFGICFARLLIIYIHILCTQFFPQMTTNLDLSCLPALSSQLVLAQSFFFLLLNNTTSNHLDEKRYLWCSFVVYFSLHFCRCVWVFLCDAYAHILNGNNVCVSMGGFYFVLHEWEKFVHIALKSQHNILHRTCFKYDTR